MAFGAVRIIPPPPPENGRVQSGIGTIVQTEDGHDIPWVTDVTVFYSAENFVQAEITVAAQMDEVWAIPFMSEVSFLEAAKRYGYEVRKEPERFANLADGRVQHTGGRGHG